MTTVNSIATEVQNPDLNTSRSTRKNPGEFLASGWADKLSSEFSKPYMENLREFLKTELQKGHAFFPPAYKIFRALKLVDYNAIRVVILGQDPYHGAGQATGLAFAVEPNTPHPPSLQNIFREISMSFHVPEDFNFNTTLEGWAKQGVLCLNTVLTVRENKPLSHRDKGWEIFTDKVIECLIKKTEPIVFLCWGFAATQKIEKIKNDIASAIKSEDDKKILKDLAFHHVILKTSHPSPLSAYRGFLGCKHFIKTNEFLKKWGFKPIDWLI